jgi:hypothetical protein
VISRVNNGGGILDGLSRSAGGDPATRTCCRSGRQKFLRRTAHKRLLTATTPTSARSRCRSVRQLEGRPHQRERGPGIKCDWQRRLRRALMKANRRSPPPSGRLLIALAAPATGSGDAGRVCIERILRVRGRTYCPKAPKTLLSGKCRLKTLLHVTNRSKRRINKWSM